MSGKNKFKNKGGFLSPDNSSQKSKSERVDDLLQGRKAKIDAALITDDRVKAKVEELENTKNTLVKEYEEKERALEEEYKNKKQDLDNRETALKAKEDKIDQKCEDAVNSEIARIKADEKDIREKEKEEFETAWNEEKKRKEESLEQYISDKRKQIDDELNKAHKERLEAEEKKLERIHEADVSIEQKREELIKEYEKKMQDYVSKKAEYDQKVLELKEDIADLKEDQEYVNSLKEKYNQYSEKEVIKLKEQIAHHEERINSDEELIKEYRAKSAHMESYLLDDEGQSLVAKISELEAQLEDASRRNDELANMPSREEIERLRANTKELENIKIVLDDEKQKRQEAESKISAYAMSARELENARISAAALESLNNQLQMKLKYISEQYKTTQESKFKVLLDIDSDMPDLPENITRYDGGLKELCEYVRNYGALKEKLYYSLDTIRVFFASLAASDKSSRLLILQGLSGTGKSSLPRLVAKALGAECKRVSVQPSWRDNRELLGYDNDFTNRFKETEFTKYLYEASAIPNRNKLFIILLDEMNLARIEYYFADFLSVLEETDKSKWIIPLVSGYSELDEDQKPKYLDYSNEAANICVTNNIWFVGTANNDDSTALITDKVYDRAQVLDMDYRESEFTPGKISKVSIGVEELQNLFAEAIDNKDNQFNDDDMDRISQVDEFLKDMGITFGNRIVSQMRDFVPVYVACGGTKNAAIDYMLTHKILRKLDERYEPYLVSKLESLGECLDDIYGEGCFKQSLEKIEKLKERIQG